MNRWETAMVEALAEAEMAPSHADVPIGAVIVDATGKIISRAHNERELSGDPTAHAEVLAIRRAAEVIQKRSNAATKWRLTGCTLVCTLEPCTMCAGALGLARIDRLVFGAFDDKAGAISSLWDVVRDPRLNHRLEVVSGVLPERSTSLLQGFFASQR